MKLPALPDNATEAKKLAGYRLIAPFLSLAQRVRLTQALREYRLREIDRTELLAPEQLPQLASRSLWLLLGSTVGFAALDIAVRGAHHSGPLLGTGSPVLRAVALVAANIAAYVVMIPLHEALHAAIILGLGGRPRFGLKLPLAAYCTAPGQLFTRNGYTVVALAPLIGLTIVGVALTWLAPDLGACVLFGLAGNVAGAVGDLAVVGRLRQLPASTLIADTETGYTAYSA